MREIIQIQVGKCGNQVGYNFWRDIATEHGVLSDGSFEKTQKITDFQTEKIGAFFREIGQNEHEARSILIDLDPECLPNIQSKQFSGLFDPKMHISGNHQTDSNWAIGYYQAPQTTLEQALNAVRIQLER